MERLEFNGIYITVVKTAQSLFIFDTYMYPRYGNHPFCDMEIPAQYNAYYNTMNPDWPACDILKKPHQYCGANPISAVKIVGLSSYPTSYYSWFTAKYIQSCDHLPALFFDVPCIRIALNSSHSSMSSSEIIKKTVSDNINTVQIGFCRISYKDKDDVLNCNHKLKFFTINQYVTWYLDVINKSMASLDASKDYINKMVEFHKTIPAAVESHVAASGTLNKCRQFLTDLYATESNYEVLLFDGWDIVSVYQKMKSSSCMVGFMSDWGRYSVEPYALSKNAQVAILVSKKQDKDDIIDSIKRGTKIVQDNEELVGVDNRILARCMVWKFDDQQDLWFDRMYGNSDNANNNHILTVFKSLLLSNGIKQYRDPFRGIIEDVGFTLTLTPASSDGEWDEDDYIAIPYMDSFDYGKVLSNGDVKCYRGVAPKGSKYIGLKSSSGLQERLSRKPEYTCDCCGDGAYTEDAIFAEVASIRRGMVNTTSGVFCSTCFNDYYYYLNSRQYGDAVVADSDDVFEIDDEYYLIGDPNPIEGYEVDERGRWVEIETKEAV